MRQYLSFLLLSTAILFLSTGCTLKQPETPKEVAAKKPQPNVQKLDYFGSMSMLSKPTPLEIDEALTEEPPAVGEFIPTLSAEQAAQSITEQALKAKAGKRALPLIAHWNTGAQSDLEGMSPDYMISLVEEGYHVLPSWELDPYWAPYIPLEYYEKSIKRAAELKLPLVFISNAYASALTQDPYFLNTPAAVNPNLIDTKGNVIETLSPMGSSAFWKKAGEKWIQNTLMLQLQQWYPNPPLVIFLSRNEAQRLNWTELQRSQRYASKYNTTQTSEQKRKFISDAWFERYRALQDGMKGKLTTTWAKNSIFVERNAFANTSMGKTEDWMNDSTYTQDALSVWPLIFNGASVDFALQEGEDDTSNNSPHLRANNMPFMLEDTKFLNDDFWWENSIGGNGILNENERYRGFTQFDLWLNRPSVVREASNENEDRKAILEHFQELIDSVEMIHNNDLLKDFWENGELVKNPNAKHPYDKNIPEVYRDELRWYMLDTDVDGVWAFALVKGEAPNREWLVFVQSGDGDVDEVNVNIPDYHSILISAVSQGNFFTITSELLQKTSLRKINVSYTPPTYIVSSISELEAIMPLIKSGDIIELKNGNYTENCTLILPDNLTQKVTIRSETLNGAQISGILKVQSDYITIEGFLFSGNGSIIVSGNNTIIRRNTFQDSHARRWITINPEAYSAEICYCLFQNKNNDLIEKEYGNQVIQVNATETDTKPHKHSIHHNHFKDIKKGKYGNGYETIQLYTVNNPFVPKGIKQENLIEYNLFENCSSEDEIISVKSNGNHIKNNTIIDSEGKIVLRQCASCTVSNNYIRVLNNKFLETGIRIQGPNQIVSGNYIIGNTKSGITIHDGQSNYAQVVSATIENNVVDGARFGLRLGFGNETIRLPFANSIVKSNTFIVSEKPILYADRGIIIPLNIIWQNNIVNLSNSDLPVPLKITSQPTYKKPIPLLETDVGPLASGI